MSVPSEWPTSVTGGSSRWAIRRFDVLGPTFDGELPSALAAPVATQVHRDAVVVLLEVPDDPVPDVGGTAQAMDQDDRWPLADARVVEGVAVDVREHVAPSVRWGLRVRTRVDRA
jgi:hypothetical protein